MSFLKLNKALVASKQNIIDVAIQEYGSIEAIFKVIDQNVGLGLSIDNASLEDFVGTKILADNRTDQEIDTVRKFFLDDVIVVNEDVAIFGGAYSYDYSNSYDNI